MTDELSAEDQFRLQVLLAQDVKAVRLDEANMILYALTSEGEANIPLTPNCRGERYARLVREHLSGHALGSPGGYPVFLSRWTRHSQVEGVNLGKLLLTGEPEAVVAVAYSPALTDELAKYAWWAQPSIENARLMLRRKSVTQGHMGPILAEFLAEHLPFLQEDQMGIMDTVAVLIYSGALDAKQLENVWNRGRRSNSHYVAFLEMAAVEEPYPLPCPLAAHPDLEATRQALAPQLERREPVAQALLKAFSPEGQAFLAASAEILERPETQEVVSRTLNAIGRYFAPGGDPEASAAAVTDPTLAQRLTAAAHLAVTSEEKVRAIFNRSTAIGSLMRRKIEPITSPLLADIRLLLAPGTSGGRRRSAIVQ